MRAVVLAGGFGKRLRPLTDTVPKPMIAVAGKPILAWQISWLQRYGVVEFVLCVGHLKENVMDYFGDGDRLGVKVKYAVEDEPLGTAGALRNAVTTFPSDEPFFALNGDVLTDLGVPALLERRRQTNAVGALALVPLPSPYGEVVTDKHGYITTFVEKPRLTSHWINGGVYCLNPSITPYLPQVGSIEQDVFPVLAREGKLTAHKYPDDFWMSIDSPKDIDEAAKRLLRVVK